MNCSRELLACGLVLCVDVQDAIGVHVKADIDLGDPPGRRGDPAQLEFAEQVVVARAAALALVDLNQDARLVVQIGAEGLREHTKASQGLSE